MRGGVGITDETISGFTYGRAAWGLSDPSLRRCPFGLSIHGSPSLTSLGQARKPVLTPHCSLSCQTTALMTVVVRCTPWSWEHHRLRCRRRGLGAGILITAIACLAGWDGQGYHWLLLATMVSDDGTATPPPTFTC
jgi:hypothetical protein